MAQHLKRKQTFKAPAPGDDEESFVTIGTPLPSLNSKKTDQNLFVPIWKQEVTDEQGRRRLHGAFTGGFSAGYFNTVGSKEGWNPTEFKSSRNDPNRRETGFNQRPEDFMDEEDLAELAQSKQVQTNSIFGSTAPTQSHLPTRGYDPLAGNIDNDSEDPVRQFSRPSNLAIALNELIKPSDLRAGYQIMRKMGWRDGQGIGPRITHERKLLLASKLGVDLHLELDPEEDPERKKHLYAPIDRPLTTVQPWHGISGLGYSKSTHLTQLKDSFDSFSSRHISSQTKSQGPKIPQGSSFGLGALNDTEDDDQDIYADTSDQVTSDPRARRLLKLSDEGTNIRATSCLSSGKTLNRSTDQLIKYFKDNSALPKGFCVASTPVKDLPSTQPSVLTIPDGWHPAPKRIWDAAAVHAQEPLGPGSRHSKLPINAHDRARLIGEEAPPKSVFDFISAKDKARLEDAKQLAQISTQSKVSRSEVNREDSISAVSIIVPRLDGKIAQAALRGFMPFSHDLPKQARYKLYLQSQAGMLPNGTQFAPKATEQMTVEVINKELDGFAKSALMFKPMSAMMASRFTSATSTAASGELAAPEPGLRQPIFVDEKIEENSTLLENEKEQTKEPETISQAAHAVRMDMFGMMTRSIKTFYPQKLLCKRFNVPNPFPDGPPVEAAPKPTSKNLSDFLSSHGFQPAVSVPTPQSDSSKNEDNLKDNVWLQKGNDEVTPQSINQVGLGGDETQGREILTSTRPSIDLFKAIFADGSEDEESNTGMDDLENHSADIVHTQIIKSKGDFDSAHDLKETDKHVSSLTPIVVDPKAVENLASFRPTFSRKTQNQDEDTPSNSNVIPTNKKSSNNKKKKRPVLISFEEDQTEDYVESKKQKRKKPISNEKSEAHDEDNSSSRKFELDQVPPSASERTIPKVHDSTKISSEQNDLEDHEWVEAKVPPINIHSSEVKNQKNFQGSNSNKVYKKISRMKASDLMD